MGVGNGLRKRFRIFCIVSRRYFPLSGAWDDEANVRFDLSAEAYKFFRRRNEKKKNDRRLAAFSTMDNKAIARADEKRRVKRDGEKAV